MDPDEDVLKAIPSKALGATLSSCDIVYPKSLMHADDVRVAIRDLLKRGKKKARRAKYFNLACAPFTLPLFLSPVSNFPIYWFLYRAREAWIGCKGAESAKEILQRRLAQPELIGEDDREIQKLTEFECTRSSDNEDDGNKSTEACCRIAAHDESNCAVTFAPCNKLDEVFGSFSSSFASDEKKLNFWRRLTAVQLDSTEIEDNYEMNFVRALGEIEKLTGATKETIEKTLSVLNFSVSLFYWETKNISRYHSPITQTYQTPIYLFLKTSHRRLLVFVNVRQAALTAVVSVKVVRHEHARTALRRRALLP